MSNTFHQATKRQARLRFALSGPSGSGKTFTALAVGVRLAELAGGRVAYIDTEHGSAEKYADLWDFDTVAVSAPFHPDRLIKLLRAAADEGYPVVVVDSLSHWWSGAGGLLELVDEIARKSRNPNSFAAWKDATPIQNRLIEALLAYPGHLIGCMRSKTEWVLEEVERGGRKSTVPRKIGTAPDQRQNVEYEFDITGDMDMDHLLVIAKSRMADLAGEAIHAPGAELADRLWAWLSSGEPAAPAPAIEPPPVDRKAAYVKALAEQPAQDRWGGDFKTAARDLETFARDVFSVASTKLDGDQFDVAMDFVAHGGDLPPDYLVNDLVMSAAVRDAVAAWMDRGKVSTAKDERMELLRASCGPGTEPEDGIDWAARVLDDDAMTMPAGKRLDTVRLYLYIGEHTALQDAIGKLGGGDMSTGITSLWVDHLPAPEIVFATPAASVVEQLESLTKGGEK